MGQPASACGASGQTAASHAPGARLTSSAPLGIFGTSPNTRKVDLENRLREAAEIVRRGNDYVRGWILIEEDGTHTVLGGGK
jgi:DNA-binding IclR family transcriptional regulator